MFSAPADAATTRRGEIIPTRGSVPDYLPLVRDTVRPDEIANDIRTAILAGITQHVGHAIGAARRAGIFAAHGNRNVDRHQELMIAAIMATRYGRVYWIRPDEARWRAPRNSAEIDQADQLGRWLEESGWHIRLFNAAFLAYLESPGLERLKEACYVPKNGFQAVDQRRIIIHRSAGRRRPADAIRCPRPLYDPHDFAHLAAATLSPCLYGVKLREGVGISRLPAHLRNLVAGFGAQSEPLFADGAMFSGYLHALFFSRALHAAHEDISAATMAAELIPFLLGERGLVDYRTERIVTPKRSINAAELALIAQNQAYEMGASEIEQFLFVRGAPDGADDLAKLPASARIAAIANLTSRTYHERRNIAKRRAQRLAYKAVAGVLRDKGAGGSIQHELADMTYDQLTFRDYDAGRRRNLFEEVTARVVPARGRRTR